MPFLEPLSSPCSCPLDPPAVACSAADTTDRLGSAPAIVASASASASEHSAASTASSLQGAWWAGRWQVGGWRAAGCSLDLQCCRTQDMVPAGTHTPHGPATQHAPEAPEMQVALPQPEQAVGRGRALRHALVYAGYERLQAQVVRHSLHQGGGTSRREHVR